MATGDPRSLGVSLISGSAGGPWEIRSSRLRALLTTLLGSDGPTARPLPDPKASGERVLQKVRPTGRGRATAEEAAIALVDALVNRSWAEVAPYLEERVWALWPDGTVARHDRGELLTALEARAGRAAKVIPEKPRSYGPSELRSVLPRGIPEALEELTGRESAVVVTLALDSPGGPAGGVTLVLREDASGWRARNLPFPQLDAAHRASAPVNKEGEAARAADRFVRHLLAGHDKHVRSLRNVLADRLILGAGPGTRSLLAAPQGAATPDRVEPAEALAAISLVGPHRAECSEVVFRGTTEVPETTLAERLGRARSDALQRRAKEVWGAPFARLGPKVYSVALGELDAASGEVTPADPATVLAIQLADRPTDPKTARPRLAGLWL